MADGLVLNLGTGGATLWTDDLGVAGHAQGIKILDATDNGTNRLIITAGGAAKVDGSAVNQPVVGPAASGSTSSGNPVRTGANFNTTQPTVTTGQTVDLQATARGGLIVAPGVDNFAVQAAQSGTWNIGTVTTLTTLSTITNVVHVDDNAGSLTIDNAQLSVVGSGTEATAMRVTIATDSTGVLSVDDNGGSLTIDGTVTANAGTNLNTSLLALEAGGNLATIAGAVRAEDTVSADADKGIGVFAIRKATPANLSSLDGDYEFLQMSAGRLWVDASGVTLTVSGTVTTTPPANASTNVAQFGGTNVSTGTGAGGVGIPRVTISNDSSLAANQSVNVAQMNGVATTMGNGVAGTGVQRVAIASDNTAFGVNATLAAETTKVIGQVVVNSPATAAAGLSMSSVLLTASNNLTSTKASAGIVYGIQAFGTGSAPYWLKLFNKASAPVIATDAALIVKRILVPANATAANGAGVIVPINDIGLYFSTGIAWAAVGLQADADTTNTAAAGAVNIDFK